MNELYDLQKWYASHCDGDWEHANGIVIESLDNPGWHVTIDLSDTLLSSCHFEAVQQGSPHLPNSSWYICKKEDCTYEATCSPMNLSVVIQIFLSWANANTDTTAWDQQVESLMERCTSVTRTSDPHQELRSVYFQLLDIPNEHPRKKEAMDLLETCWKSMTR